MIESDADHSRMVTLCRVEELPEGTSRGFRLNHISLFAVCSQGRFYVYRNRCPHWGVELEWVENQFLSADAALIQCSSHGALFIIEDGSCVAGPCLGQSLQAIPSVVKAGELLVHDLTAEAC